MIDLSIIVPMYNAENYISQCINSLVNQNFSISRYEIIVLDDGSTDSSYEIVENISKTSSNVHLYKQKNQGVSIARNSGISIAKGTYLYFVDADDYIIDDCLSELFNICNTNNLDVLEFSMIRTSSRDLNEIESNSFSLNKKDIHNGVEYVSQKYFTDSNCVYFYKRSFVQTTGVKFIEGRTKQDLMFNAEILPLASRIAFVPCFIYVYVINPDSIWTSTDPVAAKRSIDDFLFMTLRYAKLIEKYSKMNIDLTIFNRKIQAMLFNIFKRLLKSGMNKKQIMEYILILKTNDLYPLQKYTGNSAHGKFLSFLFNKKILFLYSCYLYRVLKIPIEKTYISYYSNKKENLVKTIAAKKNN